MPCAPLMEKRASVSQSSLLWSCVLCTAVLHFILDNTTFKEATELNTGLQGIRAML